MISDFFYETLKIAVPITILIILLILFTSKVNLVCKKTWRLPVWGTLGLSLIYPTTFILEMMNRFFPVYGVKDKIQGIYVKEFMQPVSFNEIIEKSKTSIIAQVPDFTPNWIFKIWILGICLYAIYLIFHYFRFKRDIRIWAKPVDFDSEDRKDVLPVYIYPKLTSAVIVGCFRPIILLPEIDLTLEQKKIMIEHEYVHWRRKDLWKKMFFQVIQIIHWYNPAIHWMVKEVNLDIELRCDSDLIKKKGSDFIDQYSAVIIQTMKTSVETRKSFSMGWNSQKDMVLKRLENIYDIKTRKGKVICITTLMLVVVTGTYIYANNDIVSFDSLPTYQQLLSQVIENRDERIRLEQQSSAGTKDYVILTAAMLEDPKYKKSDGTVDEIALYEDQCILQGARNTPVSPWENKIYYYNSCSGFVEPHVLESGTISIYYNKIGDSWKLNVGNSVVLKLKVDNTYYGSSGYVSFGYIKDGYHEVIQEVQIDKNRELRFDVLEDGEYQFYLFCGAFEPIVIQWMEIFIL